MNCCGSEHLVNQSFSLIISKLFEDFDYYLLVIGLILGFMGFGIGLRWSSSWIRRQSKDIYVKKAQSEGYRARSAYKLLEINEKFKILRPKMTVMECGGAPGSWTQVLTQKVHSGEVISCDLLDYDPVDHAIILPQSDFTLPQTQDIILGHLKADGFDLVLSDMAPKRFWNV
uniref:rRNA methyltransferase 2, mitochondrial n=1 Tax=Caligus clemensi TaxID=344056 RepID=C1BZV5_CALCM|nr:ribosomal RNA methyltransferase CG11447 [Caligus clemensi]